MKQKDAILTFEACRYEDVAKYTKVISDEGLDYFMWIHFDPNVIRHCVLIDVRELNQKEKVWIPARFIQTDDKAWMKAPTTTINRSPGQHIYKFSFVNRFNDVTFSLYISYIMQTEVFEKPYLYMDREPVPPCCCKCSDKLTPIDEVEEETDTSSDSESGQSTSNGDSPTGEGD